MKNYILLFITLLLCANNYAQNTTMAKAFYKKAIKAYEEKNYKEALKLIEKTKENLEGNTNPDIIYIEAKSRYENEINITKTKKLFNQFLNEADENDERKDEIAGFLVEIEESSDNYYDNGNAKTKTNKFDNGSLITHFFEENGNQTRSEHSDNEKGVYLYDYYVNGIKKVTIDKNGIKEKYYDNQGNMTQYLEYVQSFRLKFELSSFKSFNSWSDYDLNFKEPCLIRAIYPFESIELIEKHKKLQLGTIKRIQIGWFPKFSVIYFDENGKPTKKIDYKRKKTLGTYLFNSNTKEWERQ